MKISTNSFSKKSFTKGTGFTIKAFTKGTGFSIKVQTKGTNPWEGVNTSAGAFGAETPFGGQTFGSGVFGHFDHFKTRTQGSIDH